MSGFLLDTNVVAELVKPRPALRVVRWLDDVEEELLFLSALTLGEIRKGIVKLGSGARVGRLDAWLEGELKVRFAGRILPIDEAVADRWGVLAGRAAATGTPLPVVDGLLAATALHHNLTLVTRNSRDVSRTGVSVFSPWEG